MPKNALNIYVLGEHCLQITFSIHNLFIFPIKCLSSAKRSTWEWMFLGYSQVLRPPSKKLKNYKKKKSIVYHEPSTPPFRGEPPLK